MARQVNAARSALWAGRWLVLLQAVLVMPSAAADDPKAEPDPRQKQEDNFDRPKFEPIPFDKAEEFDLKQLQSLLGSKHWHYRVFGLLRLERFSGEGVKPFVLERLADEDWHVRCFAVRAAVRLGVEPPADALAKETDGRVVRLALRLGLPVDAAIVRRVSNQAMAARDIDTVMVGIEAAAASDDEQARKAAVRRIEALVKAMTDQAAVIVGGRLAEVLGLPATPATRFQWIEWARANGAIHLPKPKLITDQVKQELTPWVATIDRGTMGDIASYLDTLRAGETEITVAIDATGSMGHIIRRTLAEVDRLVLIFNDLAKSMRVAIVAYRDAEDKPVVEVMKMTDKINQARDFLSQLKAEGGGDVPESVKSGLEAAAKVGWKREAAMKQVIIIGDAPPHERDMPAIKEMVAKFDEQRIIVHTMVVGEFPPTAQLFQQIAAAGKGRCVTLEDTDALAKLIMKLSVDLRVQLALDDFYDLYVKLCL